MEDSAEFIEQTRRAEQAENIIKAVCAFLNCQIIIATDDKQNQFIDIIAYPIQK